MNIKTFFRGFIILAVLSLALVGCSAAKKPLTPSNPNGTTQPNVTQPGTTPNAGTGGQSLSVPGVNITTGDTVRARGISQQLLALGNIKRAPVVINGSTAIVGVQLTDSSSAGINKINQAMQNVQSRTAPSVDLTGITTSRDTGIPGTKTNANPSKASPDGIDRTGYNPPENALTGTNTNTTNQSPDGIGNNAAPGTTTPVPGTTNAPGTTPTTDVKSVIAQAVKRIDPSVTKVYVTTDRTMVDRLQRLESNLLSEMTDITNKIQAGGGVR